MNDDEIEAIMAAGGEMPTAQFDELPTTGSGNGGAGMASAEGTAGLSLLYDLPLPVSVELGRTRLPVQEILSLGRGSVVQLDRLAGEPVDLYVGDRKFAQGEVVVLGEQFGVRITRILAGPSGITGALA